MKIGIIGTGYVGLVTGVMLARLGHEIICIDSDLSKIERLKKGECIIYENNLEENLRQALDSNLITFHNDYSPLSSCEVVFICVGTPANLNGSANLDYVKEAITLSAKNLDPEALIIIKSTVPPRSAHQMQLMLAKQGYKNSVASNPEFLREGSAVHDFEKPDRIVIGVSNIESRLKLEKIYAKKIAKNIPLVVTDTNTAEMIKYTSNSFLAIKLSFINEMANLCEKLDADIEKLSEGVGYDKRIGSLFLKAGPGYGGSCFPKDTSALAILAEEYNSKSEVLNAAIRSNSARYGLMSDKIKNLVKGKHLAVLGLAFKARTDDIRESPAVEIIKLLLQDGYSCSVYDPVALENFKNLNLNNVTYSNSILECCANSNGVIILTEWQEFAHINWQEVKKIVRDPVLIDLRKIAAEDKAKEAGFKFYTIGRASNAE